MEETEFLEKPAHHREIEMRMRVDEARHEDDIAELLVAGRLGRGRVSARTNPGDLVAFDDDRAVLDRRPRDRQNPVRVIARAIRAFGVFAHGRFGVTALLRGGQSRVGSVPGMKYSVYASSVGHAAECSSPEPASTTREMIAFGRGQSGGDGLRS